MKINLYKINTLSARACLVYYEEKNKNEEKGQRFSLLDHKSELDSIPFLIDQFKEKCLQYMPSDFVICGKGIACFIEFYRDVYFKNSANIKVEKISEEKYDVYALISAEKIRDAYKITKLLNEKNNLFDGEEIKTFDLTEDSTAYHEHEKILAYNLAREWFLLKFKEFLSYDIDVNIGSKYNNEVRLAICIKLKRERFDLMISVKKVKKECGQDFLVKVESNSDEEIIENIGRFLYNTRKENLLAI